jgi:hypothetical protein
MPTIAAGARTHIKDPTSLLETARPSDHPRISTGLVEVSVEPDLLRQAIQQHPGRRSNF